MWRRYVDSDYIVRWQNRELQKWESRQKNLEAREALKDRYDAEHASQVQALQSKSEQTDSIVWRLEGMVNKMNAKLADMDDEKRDSLSKAENSRTRISSLESACSELRSENTELRSEAEAGRLDAASQILIVNALQEQVDNLIDYQRTTVGVSCFSFPFPIAHPKL